MKKRFLAFLTAICLIAAAFPLGISAEGEESATVILTTKFDNPNKYFSEGSASDTDPRFELGYSTFVPTKLGNNLPKSNIAKKNMGDYLFTAAEKEAGSSSEAVVSFYIRCSLPSKLQARFYHYANASSQNATSYVSFEITEENAGKWVNISIPLNDFTVNDTSKDKTFSQFVVSNAKDNTVKGKVFDITTATIYSNANFPIYADAEGIAIQKTAEMRLHQRLYLVPELTAPEGYTAVAGDITYSSDNELVATVNSDGTVTACGEGTAKITVSAGALSADCAVTVSPAAEAPKSIGTYTIKSALTDNAMGTYKLPLKSVTSDYQRVQLFGNGADTGRTYNLIDYMNSQDSIVAFYIRASAPVELKSRFFCTANGDGKYKDTNDVCFGVDKADEWQLIRLPLGSYKFAYDAKFSRFDIFVPKAFTADESSFVEVTAIKVYSADPYCAVISDCDELAPELPYYISGQTVRFAAVPSESRIPVPGSLTVINAGGKTDIAVNAVAESDMFEFIMPNCAVKLNADFIEKERQSIYACALISDSAEGSVTVTARAYLPVSDDAVCDTAVFEGSEWNIADMGLIVVPEELLFADETPDESCLAKKVSVTENGGIRAERRSGAVDYKVKIENTKEGRKYACRTYITLTSGTESRTLLGDIFVK